MVAEPRRPDLEILLVVRKSQVLSTKAGEAPTRLKGDYSDHLQMFIESVSWKERDFFAWGSLFASLARQNLRGLPPLVG